MLLIPRMYHFSGKIISRIFFVKSLFFNSYPLFFVSLVEKKEAPVSVSQLAYTIPTGKVIGSKMIKWSLSGQWELNSGSAMKKEKLQLSGMWNWGYEVGSCWEEPGCLRMKSHTEESWAESHGEIVCFLDKAPGTTRARLLSSFPLAHVNDFSFCESQF